jgi:transposase
MLCLISPESRVPEDHPQRRIKKLVDQVLQDPWPLFDQTYAQLGRPSIPPERLLKGKMLHALCTVLSENLLIQALEYNLLFRWFLDLNLTDPIWDNSTFTKNQERLLLHQTAELFFARIVALARQQSWSVTNISPLMARSSTPGPARRNSSPGAGRRNPPTEIRATPVWTSTASNAATPPTRAPPTSKPNWPAKAGARRPGCADGLHALMENRHVPCAQAEIMALDRKIDWQIAGKRSVIKALAEGAEKEALKAVEKTKAAVRALVEHPFHIVRNLLRHRKVRYRGLAKNGHQPHVHFGLANVVMAARTRATG